MRAVMSGNYHTYFWHVRRPYAFIHNRPGQYRYALYPAWVSGKDIHRLARYSCPHKQIADTCPEMSQTQSFLSWRNTVHTSRNSRFQARAHGNPRLDLVLDIRPSFRTLKEQ